MGLLRGFLYKEALRLASNWQYYFSSKGVLVSLAFLGIGVDCLS